MPNLRIHSNKNTRNFYILGVFIFLFLFFQPISPKLSFFESNTFGVNVAKGQCVPEAPVDSTGGLVPCGRIMDDQDTPLINEHDPCSLCAMFYMLKEIINFVMTLAIGIGVFILVVAGLLYALSTGNSRKIELAKSAVTSTIIGIAIIFIAWLAIAVILQGMGYANMATWNQVNCNVTSGGPPTILPFCGDGIVNNGETCDWSVTPARSCNATIVGAPAYCASAVVDGTQGCNCTCDGWKACVANLPVTSNNYGSCSSATIYMNGYVCCELTGCQADACCNGENSANSTLPGGYTQQGILNYSGGNCKLGQNGTSWAISINHTTAGYQCWQ